MCGSSIERSHSRRGAQPGAEHHVLVGADWLILSQLALGAPKLLLNFVQSILEGSIAIVVLGFGTHHLERPHLNVHRASKERTLPSDVYGGGIKVAEVLARSADNALSRVVAECAP